MSIDEVRDELSRVEDFFSEEPLPSNPSQPIPTDDDPSDRPVVPGLGVRDDFRNTNWSGRMIDHRDPFALTTEHTARRFELTDDGALRPWSPTTSHR